MKLQAFDLTRITKDQLRYGLPLSMWPVQTIDIENSETRASTCIASWKWDISAMNEVSPRLSECAWDGLNLKFKFLLCDLISIPQHSPDTVDVLITFSKLYSVLHSVVAYDADADVRRTWLKNEAARILSSPTTLYYIYHKWQLRVPLNFSLIIRQICTRRLGMHNLDFSRIGVCDTDEAFNLSLKDLGLQADQVLKNASTISLDRRLQLYSSDVLLVHEISQEIPRPELIDKLRLLKSNSMLIPALLAVWAAVNGLSISVRGCDWPATLVKDCVWNLLTEVANECTERITVEPAADETILFKGAISGTMILQLVSPPYNLSEGIKNLFVFNDGQSLTAVDNRTKDRFLHTCLAHVYRQVSLKMVAEPLPLTDDDPQYELLFDNNPHY